ncbi:mast cell carboxypeptidase A-like [Diorhabda sublineata]|uniref:mast cell carboxypeptidase A-like n=1 Tax=Diorhabda sublineata TaxID=1163346 RepID=UPI0024E0828D|nr:mast cell carboxypeptidase A-like [Diorhabda sublineata]
MEKKYPERLQLEIIGTSIEKRPIYLVIISDNSYDHEKMATLIEAGSDGSDRLAIASALYLIDFITKNKSLVKITNYIILPCLNPDAYHKTINKCPTNSTPLNLSCNYPLLLGVNYMGDISTELFLEAIGKWKQNFKFDSPVTKAFYNVLNNFESSIKLFVSLQENGKSLVYPFGCSTEEAFDAADLEQVALSAQSVMKRINFEIAPLCEISGIVFGSVIDFLKFYYRHIKFTYIFNIKDKHKVSRTGDILIYGDDILRCIKSLAKNVFMIYNRLNSKYKCN